MDVCVWPCCLSLRIDDSSSSPCLEAAKTSSHWPCVWLCGGEIFLKKKVLKNSFLAAAHTHTLFMTSSIPSHKQHGTGTSPVATPSPSPPPPPTPSVVGAKVTNLNVPPWRQMADFLKSPET